MWSGDCDDAGIPLVQTDRGNRFSFPITVFQKGLGHWDRWVLSDRTRTSEWNAFRAIADWAVRSLDARGGWPCWHLIDRGTSTPYSSMAQGQGISILARAYATTGDSDYLAAAERAATAMTQADSGLEVARHDDGLWLEEYPGSRMTMVLNGWIFSLMGLHDITYVSSSQAVRDALDETVATIARALPQYDCGYWSMYDLGGTIASPFYHRLHIAQLQALQKTFTQYDRVFAEVVERWQRYHDNPLTKSRALAVKVVQKMRDTGNEEFT